MDYSWTASFWLGMEAPMERAILAHPELWLVGGGVDIGTAPAPVVDDGATTTLLLGFGASWFRLAHGRLLDGIKH